MSAISSAINALSPAGYWKLDETSGTSAADSGPNGLTGTYTGTYTLGGTALNAAPDAGERSVSVNGAGHVSIANSSYIVTNAAFSVFCLCNRNTSTSGALWHKGNTAVGGNQGVFLTATAAGALYIQYFSGSWRAVSTGATLPAGVNSSVTFIYLGGTSVVTVVNGVDYSATLPVALPTSNQPLYIGTSWQGSRRDPFYGSLDEVAWFGTNITTNQAKDLHAKALTPTVLIYGSSVLSAVGVATFSAAFSVSGQSLFTPETAEREFNILSSSVFVSVTDQRDFQLSIGSAFDARSGVQFSLASGSTLDLDARGLVYSSFNLSQGSILAGEIVAQVSAAFSTYRSQSFFVPERGYITRSAISSSAKSIFSPVGASVVDAAFASQPGSAAQFSGTEVYRSAFSFTDVSLAEFYGTGVIPSVFSTGASSSADFAAIAAVRAALSVVSESSLMFSSSFAFEELDEVSKESDAVFVSTRLSQMWVRYP